MWVNVRKGVSWLDVLGYGESDAAAQVPIAVSEGPGKQYHGIPVSRKLCLC